MSGELFVTAPGGIAPLLAEEVRALGVARVSERPAGVSLAGDLELALRLCLWSRLANRVLLVLARFPAADGDALYAGVRGVEWREHLAPEGTLAVDVTAAGARITHTRYAAQRAKDAVVDQFREALGVRPSVSLRRPDLRLHLHLHGAQAVLSLDLSGESLHRRGYRARSVVAPLKENLAAAVLWRARWPAIAAAGGAFLDPMCGSGTLPVEAALMAGDVAPGLLREEFGFLRWPGHDAPLWERLRAEARERAARGRARMPPILGCDADAGAVRAARACVSRAGLAAAVRIERRDLEHLRLPAGRAAGLVAVNPPYGERLGERRRLGELYARLGAALRREAGGWQAVLLTGNPDLAQRLGIRARRAHTLYNGAIECRLLRFELDPAHYREPRRGPPPQTPAAAPGGGGMFANRLRKNLRRLGRWARREGVTCYRLYDADMPEYALAVDLYAEEDGTRHAFVQEYAPPAKVDAAAARRRREEALAVLQAELALPGARLHLRTRRRQRGGTQYGKLAEAGRFHVVTEGGLRLLVNFEDYLDTGLYLDLRGVRALLRRLARGRRFLNLFSYTGAATVAAAAGGARATTSVDLSRTYLEWERRNLALNGLDGAGHAQVRADCTAWLEAADSDRYGLVLLGPPSFSTSARMRGTLDVQRDHARLIELAARRLAPGGVLLFTTPLRRFRMRVDAAELVLEDISRETVPPDFARNPRIHRCWRITRRDGKRDSTAPARG